MVMIFGIITPLGRDSQRTRAALSRTCNQDSCLFIIRPQRIGTFLQCLTNAVCHFHFPYLMREQLYEIKREIIAGRENIFFFRRGDTKRTVTVIEDELIRR